MRKKSAVSSTSPSASRRFFPTSIERSAEYKNCRSLISSAAARISATRSCHGRFDQAGYAAFAAAIAAFAVLRSPLLKVPTTLPSIGDFFTKVSPAVDQLPLMKLPCALPMSARACARPASYPMWISSLESFRVAYVIFNFSAMGPSLLVRRTCGAPSRRVYRAAAARHEGQRPWSERWSRSAA